jgi:hypothetical protein
VVTNVGPSSAEAFYTPSGMPGRRSVRAREVGRAGSNRDQWIMSRSVACFSKRDLGSGAFGTNDADIRALLDPYADRVEASEFGWGSGIEPPSVRGKPPADGGRYRGTSPPCDPLVDVRPWSVDLSLSNALGERPLSRSAEFVQGRTSPRHCHQQSFARTDDLGSASVPPIDVCRLKT